MKRKRKSPRPASRMPAAGPSRGAVSGPTTLVAIDVAARKGRNDIMPGGRVTILGGGLYAGETAIVERLISGVIPSALVRTEAGRTRQVRTIDLQPAARPVATPSGT